MTLGMRQRLFARLVPGLIDKAHSLGFEVTLGEVWRSEYTATQYARNKLGIKMSLHRDKLAIDINLFRNGVYLTKTEDHRDLGEWWEGQHPLARWGGRFGDGNHYSIEYQGRK